MVAEFEVVPSIIGILFLVIPAMMLGKICKKFGISEIIGFVVAGVILGPFAIGGQIPLFEWGIIHFDDATIALWEMSGIIILFSAGLHFTFRDLIRAGPIAAVIGALGVTVPLVAGYGISQVFGFGWEVSTIIGATLSATSIAVSVTILKEIKREKAREGKILVSSAVIDDVIGLAVLSAVAAIIINHATPTIELVTITLLENVGLWFALLLVAVFILPKIIKGIAIASPSSIEVRGTKQGAALGAAFGFSALSFMVGLNPIVGAFAAGMGLADSKLASQVREFIGRLKVIAEPLFFAIIGAHVNIGLFFDVNWIFFAGILIVAVSSKVFGCGLPAALMLKDTRKGLSIGYGMVARGEVAFITMGIGVVTGALNDEVYATLVFVILATIIISPTLLRRAYRGIPAESNQ